MHKARKILVIGITLALGLCLPLLISASFCEVQAAAGGIQNCTVGESCTIGEFLYDDDSQPLTGASCTLTSKYPDGTDHLVSEAMTGESDGWYGYTFTSPSTTGLYRATVGCTSGADSAYIDRSFEVKSVSLQSLDADSIASAVWSYSGRTVTSFGSLISDFWANTTRTLTGTGLSSGNLATQDDVISVRNNLNNLSASGGDLDKIKDTSDETRLLIEKIVNAPIIENVLEDQELDLNSKIDDTKSVAGQIFINSEYIISKSAQMRASWKLRDGKFLLSDAIEIAQILGEEGDSSDSSTLFGQVNWLRGSWNWDEVSSLYNGLLKSKKNLENIKEDLADYQKNPESYSETQSLVANFLALEKTVSKLNSKINTTQTIASGLNSKSLEVEETIKNLPKVNTQEDYIKVRDLKNQVIALNKVPGAGNALVKTNNFDNISLKNTLLGLMGIIESNIKMLSSKSGSTLTNTWLEIGSIVFKTIATNPSNLISQDVEIKYYLPAEIKKEDIIKTDAGLDIGFDSDKNQLYVYGTFNLSSGQTKTFSVETKDIWEYSEEELSSLCTQAEELGKPLEKTAYYAQGVSLKSDINASLDRIDFLQKDAITPEDKIRAYREATVLKKSVEEKISGLKDLVTQVSAAATFLGYVGGSQAISVWGISAVVVAGFAVIAMYLKSISGKKVKGVQKESKKAISRNKQILAIVIFSSILSSSASGLVVGKYMTSNIKNQSVLGAEQENSIIEEEKIEETKGIQDEKNDGVGGLYEIITINETPNGFLRVRDLPDGSEIARLKTEEKAIFLEEEDNWYKVRIESGLTGWISKEYSDKEELGF